MSDDSLRGCPSACALTAAAETPDLQEQKPPQFLGSAKMMVSHPLAVDARP
ncbi:Hypothetical protein A7982_08004 [Minicystis rosea]|nr:Hypothetical protein A7982_08004 [Minicystis rosea]